jgi:glycine oxidase
MPSWSPVRSRIKPMAGQIRPGRAAAASAPEQVYGYSGYIVPRTDGRVLMGSTREDRGFDKTVSARNEPI